jgi:hypothetical protein
MDSRSPKLARSLLTISRLRRRLEPVLERIPRRVVRLILMLAGAVVVVGVALRSRSLLSPLGTVTHPHLGWLTVAQPARVW